MIYIMHDGPTFILWDDCNRLMFLSQHCWHYEWCCNSFCILSCRCGNDIEKPYHILQDCDPWWMMRFKDISYFLIHQHSSYLAISSYSTQKLGRFDCVNNYFEPSTWHISTTKAKITDVMQDLLQIICILGWLILTSCFRFHNALH